MKRVLLPPRLAAIAVLLPAAMLSPAHAPLFARSAHADAVHTPASGSAERTKILNALRPSVERRVGQDVIFVVNRLRVQNGWAFFEGSARTSNGKTLSQKYLWGETSALLKKSGGAWRVLRWGFASDTSVMEACRKNYPSAPRAIFQ